MLDFLACGHDEIGKLVDEHHNIGEVAVSFFRIQAAPNKLGVVFFDGPDAGVFEELIAFVHFDAQGIEGIHHFGCVCNDGIFFAWKFGQEMPFNLIEECELNLLWIDQYKFDLRRMLLVEDRNQDGIQANRFTLTSCTCHQQMGHFGEVKNIRFVGNGFAHHNRKLAVKMLKFIRGNKRAHRHHFRIGIRYFNTDGAFSWNRCNDAYA